MLDGCRGCAREACPVKPLATAGGGDNTAPSAAGIGQRNNALFRHCLTVARQCNCLDELLDRARMMNQTFAPPLPDAEVCKTAASAWGYQVSGNNWAGEGRRLALTHEEYDRLKADNLDAILLLLELRRRHWGREEFFLANATAQVFGWGANRFKAARDALVRHEIIRCVRRGGQGPGDPPVYTWDQGVSHGHQ